jgi:heme/copper-type cytochrome/quinol oxidase subunit 1
VGFCTVAVWYYTLPTSKGYGHSRLLAGIQFWTWLAGVGIWVLGSVLTAVMLAKVTDAPIVPLLWGWCLRIGSPVLAVGALLFLVNGVLTFVRRRSGT